MPTRRNTDLYRILGLDDKARDQRSKRIAAALWSRWQGMVNSLPPRYRASYRAAMRLEAKGSHVELELDGDSLAASVEYGFGPGGVGTQGPYDMRRTLLRSGGKSVKTGARGRYLSVPMGMSARKMRAMRGGERAYRMARELVSTVMSRGGNTKWGGSLPRGLTHKIRPKGRMVPGIGYQPPHATDPTHGIRRYVQKAGAVRGAYGTFRTISQGGKPWVHPGIKARRLIRKVAGMVGAVVREVG
jgi:hypothetical protein